MLSEKKVSTLTVSFTMVLSTSDRFMRRKMLVAMTAVLFPWSFMSLLYSKERPRRKMLMMSQRISSP